jgi:ribosome recycling factor
MKGGVSMIDTVHKETKDRMVKTIDALKKEMQRVRTGRASANMLDSVKVDYYGTLTPLSQMASISIPESRLITVQPWDATALKEIEKGILKANIGLTPSSDGKIIRISVPPLTEDRRKEIVKMVNKTCEEFKVAIRNIRRDSNELVKGLKKDGEVSEDQQNKALEKIQTMTDDHIKMIDSVYRDKEKEILDI